MEHIAVITGGTGGMGLATAKILGRGHRVIIADLDQQRLDAATAELRSLGIDADSAVCDVTDRTSVDALFDQADTKGHVRVVVHTAGVSPQMGDAQFIVRVNVVGTVNITRSFLHRADTGDALVNVASIAGHMSPGFLQPRRAFAQALTDLDACERKLVKSTKLMPRSARPGVAYSLSKAFVLWYCREMAQHFGAQGARILSVSPGSFSTTMGRLEEKSGSGELVDYSALKRLGDPEEIASVLAFAASQAPGYLTGTDILVDGGTRANLDMRSIIALAAGR
ncbi:SDR family NAD(P)-dependent oxidoreductase [Glutamicibacter endophyticus]|uniref:SDR family NAD(P)-dependent oxidoreductase n=1 Tax=Glutamicibacter endophyticus TaxID=1522174 RepID=UPI003AF09A29